MTTYLNISDRQPLTKAVLENAEYDKLTGLPKGVLLRARIIQMVANCRQGDVAALHCLDLDHFKTINERYGQSVGDTVLSTVARRLQEVIRGNDTVARTAGDQFVVLQSDVKRPSDVVRLASRLAHAIEQPIVIGAQTISLSSSSGFALVPRDGTEPESLLAKAEAAVIQTKSKDHAGLETQNDEWK